MPTPISRLGGRRPVGCTTPVNDGPQHVVVQAAFTAFNRWVDDGTPPPSAAPFRLASTNPAVLALDGHGNVIGGVRTPAVDVPVSTLSGAARRVRARSARCSARRCPFSPATLVEPVPHQERLPRRLYGQSGQGDQRGYILAADRSALSPKPKRCSFLRDRPKDRLVVRLIGPERGRRATAGCQNAVPFLGDGRVTSRASALARPPGRSSSTRPPAARSEAGKPPR